MALSQSVHHRAVHGQDGPRSDPPGGQQANERHHDSVNGLHLLHAHRTALSLLPTHRLHAHSHAPDLAVAPAGNAQSTDRGRRGKWPENGQRGEGGYFGVGAFHFRGVASELRSVPHALRVLQLGHAVPKRPQPRRNRVTRLPTLRRAHQRNPPVDAPRSLDG